MHIVSDAAVRQVQIVGTGGIFGGKGVYLFHYGQNTCTLAQGTYGKDGVLTVHIPFQAESAGYLEIGETLYLGPVQQFPRGFVIQEECSILSPCAAFDVPSPCAASGSTCTFS